MQHRLQQRLHAHLRRGPRHARLPHRLQQVQSQHIRQLLGRLEDQDLGGREAVEYRSFLLKINGDILYGPQRAWFAYGSRPFFRLVENFNQRYSSELQSGI